MASTEFTTEITKIEADWANDVNTATYHPADKAAAKLLPVSPGTTLYILSEDGRGNIWRSVTGLAPGTINDDSVSAGTEFRPSGGDGSSGFRRDFNNEVNVLWYGADVLGVINSSPAFQEIADTVPSGGKLLVIIPKGAYNLVDLITYDPSTRNIIWVQDAGVTYTNPENLYSPGVQPNLGAAVLAQRSQTYTSGDDFTASGLYISYFQKNQAGTGNYEKDALHVLAKTSDQGGVGFDGGVVAIRATGVGSAFSSDNQVWACNLFAQIDAGGDGILHGLEVNIDNNGSDNPNPNTALAKYGINVTTKSGSNGVTAAIKIGSDSQFHHGIYCTLSSLVDASSKFIELDSLFSVDGQGRVAIGHTSPSERLHIKRTSGQAQILIESDGVGGEAASHYADTGTRNWTAGLWNTTGRYTISNASNLASNVVLELDGTSVLNLPVATSAMQINGTQVIKARQTGWLATTGTVIRTNFGDASLSDTSQALRALIVDLKSHGLIGT